jgi:hypothetical protein
MWRRVVWYRSVKVTEETSFLISLSQFKLTESLWNHISTDHKEGGQLEDWRNVGESICNSGDGTDRNLWWWWWVKGLQVEFFLTFSDRKFLLISNDVRTSSMKIHFIRIYILNVKILDETVNYASHHYQSSHSHVFHFILGPNTGVPFIGSPWTAAVTGCPGGCTRSCDKAHIVKYNINGKYNLFR